MNERRSIALPVALAVMLLAAASSGSVADPAPRAPATPLARFDSAAAVATEPWPAGSSRLAEGPAELHRFTGYRLDADGRPTFSWRWGDSTVADRIVPASDGTRLTRAITSLGVPAGASTANQPE